MVYYINLFMGRAVHATAHVWRTEDSCWSPFSLGQRDGTHDVRLDVRLLYPLSNLICHNGFFFCLFIWFISATAGVIAFGKKAQSLRCLILSRVIVCEFPGTK